MRSSTPSRTSAARTAGAPPHRNVPGEPPAVGRGGREAPGRAGGVGAPRAGRVGATGGACAHADPASDMPTVLVALGADLVIRGPNGATRNVPAGDFFRGLVEPALPP